MQQANISTLDCQGPPQRVQEPFRSQSMCQFGKVLFDCKPRTVPKKNSEHGLKHFHEVYTHIHAISGRGKYQDNASTNFKARKYTVLIHLSILIYCIRNSWHTFMHDGYPIVFLFVWSRFIAERWWKPSCLESSKPWWLLDWLLHCKTIIRLSAGAALYNHGRGGGAQQIKHNKKLSETQRWPIIRLKHFGFLRIQ